MLCLTSVLINKKNYSLRNVWFVKNSEFFSWHFWQNHIFHTLSGFQNAPHFPTVKQGLLRNTKQWKVGFAQRHRMWHNFVQLKTSRHNWSWLCRPQNKTETRDNGFDHLWFCKSVTTIGTNARNWRNCITDIFWQGGDSSTHFPAPLLLFQNKMAANYKFLSKFSVLPVDKFEGECPYFRQPKQVGCFSLDEERMFLDNDSRLRYYSPPEVVNFDLRVGYKEFIRRDEEKKDRLDDMLRWIKKHPENFALSGDTSHNDGRLVCYDYKDMFWFLCHSQADEPQTEKFCLWRKLISCAKIFLMAKICAKFLSVEKLRRIVQNLPKHQKI